VVFYLSGASCSTYGPADAMVHPTTPPPFVSYKSRLVLPFWYLHTQVEMEKRPVNECSNSTVHSGSHAGDGTFRTPLSSPGLGDRRSTGLISFTSHRQAYLTSTRQTPINLLDGR